MRKVYNILLSLFVIIILIALIKLLTGYVNLFDHEPGEGLVLMLIPFFFLPSLVVLGILKMVISKNNPVIIIKSIPILVCFVIPAFMTISLRYTYEGMMLVNFILACSATLLFIGELIFCIIDLIKKKESPINHRR